MALLPLPASDVPTMSYGARPMGAAAVAPIMDQAITGWTSPLNVTDLGKVSPLEITGLTDIGNLDGQKIDFLNPGQTVADLSAAPGGWSLGGMLKDIGFLDQYDDAGKKMGQGWGGAALGAAQGIMSGWMGMQQLDMQKKMLNESKRQYNQNYAAQRTQVNTELEDRQRARVASNAGAYESVGAYMNKNGIK